MADYKIDISQLPEDVREKLAELDLELSEGNYLIYSNISLLLMNRTIFLQVVLSKYSFSL